MELFMELMASPKKLLKPACPNSNYSNVLRIPEENNEINHCLTSEPSS